jgi:hypothetical protein
MGDMDGTKVHIKFKVNKAEPMGYNQFFMGWEQYDPWPQCELFGTCLTTTGAIVTGAPISYYNGMDFGNLLNRDFIMNCYWIMTIASFFNIFGIPLETLIYFTLNIYMQLYSVWSFFEIIQAANGKYHDDEQIN